MSHLLKSKVLSSQTGSSVNAKVNTASVQQAVVHSPTQKKAVHQATEGAFKSAKTAAQSASSTKSPQQAVKSQQGQNSESAHQSKATEALCKPHLEVQSRPSSPLPTNYPVLMEDALSPFFTMSTQELEKLNAAGAQWEEEEVMDTNSIESDAQVQASEVDVAQTDKTSPVTSQKLIQDTPAVRSSTPKKNLSLKNKKKALPIIQEEEVDDVPRTKLEKMVDKTTAKVNVGKITKASVSAINAFSTRVGKYAYVRQGGSNGRGKLSCSVRLRSRVSPSVILNTLVLAACDSKALSQSTRWVDMGNNSAARLARCVEIRQCTTNNNAKLKTTTTYLPVEKYDEMHREVVNLNRQFRNWEETDHDSEMVVVNGDGEHDTLPDAVLMVEGLDFSLAGNAQGEASDSSSEDDEYDNGDSGSDSDEVRVDEEAE